MVKQIEAIEKDQKTHLEYAKIIQSKIDMIPNIIKAQNKMLLNEKNPDANNSDGGDEDDDEGDEGDGDEDEEENKSKTVGRTKSSKKIIKEDVEDKVIIVKSKVKKINK